MAVFVRSSDGSGPRARSGLTAAGLPFKVLDEHLEAASGQVSIRTMHLAKGLEFRAVAVMAGDDEVIPFTASHRSPLATMPTFRTYSSWSGTCSTLPVRERGTTCWSPEPSQDRSFWLIWLSEIESDTGRQV